MRNWCLVLFAVILACGPVSAQVDPDPDGVGIYADPEATVNSIAAEAGTNLTLYVLATNVSATEGIGGWQLAVETGSIDVELHDLTWSYAGWPVCGFSGPDRMIHVDGGGLAQAPIIHLATLHVVVLGTGATDLYVRNSSCVGAELPPTYTTAGADSRQVPLTPSSGSEDLPVFRINGSAPVATDAETWGALKSLYR